MDAKKFAVFLLAVVVSLVLVGVTGPAVVKNVRLGLDLKGGFEILYQAQPMEEGQAIDRDTLIKTAQSLEKRVNAQGVSEPEITTEGKDRIRVRIAGVADEQQVRNLLKKPAELTFRGPDGTVELNGSDFVVGGAQLGFDQTNRPMITVKVKEAEKLRKVTEKLLHQPLAIYLDDQLISAPEVQSIITDGTASITGNYTYDEAKNLRDIINMGALPLKLTEKYTQSVGATLGQRSLEMTVTAGIVAFVLILLFMIAWYRVPGLIASVTLIVFAWLLLLVMNLGGFILTLPGIAGFVLGVGMAIDANIITYERIKEEIRNGKSILSSLKAGSRVSFRTIMDANITTIIAAAVLFYFGTGSIKGFALTLIFSIVLSILTNVYFSRMLLHLLVRSNVVKKPAYFGVKESEIHAL